MEQTSHAPRGRVSRWLCPTELQRQRFLDMNDRVRAARTTQGLVMSLATLVGAFWYGWPMVLMVVLAVSTLVGLERVYRVSTRPEIASAASMAALEIILIGVMAVSGGATSPFLPFVCIPTIMLAARFRPTVVAWGVAASVLLTVVGVQLAQLVSGPLTVPPFVHLVSYAALLASVVAASTILLSAELQSRGDAVVDQLTGLFNRKALHGRFEEAAAQARLIGAPISLIIMDLDHFKQVNDEHGHDRGDLVLREVAYRMRTTLRVLDLVYRLGGEEFLVLLPGQDEAQAALLAERLIEDVAAQPLADLAVTMSAGVATTTGDDLAFDTLLKRADLALYAAKRAGRNCVRRQSQIPERVDV